MADSPPYEVSDDPQNEEEDDEASTQIDFTQSEASFSQFNATLIPSQRTFLSQTPEASSKKCTKLSEREVTDLLK